MSQETLDFLAKIGLVIACVTTIALTIKLIRRSYRTRVKYFAIRTYAERIGRFLRARYGLQEKYTPDQVQRMIREWGYSTDYDHYGLAMYCDYADFTNHYRAAGKHYNYEMMRCEISHCLFRADITFSVSDVVDASVARAQANKKRLAIRNYIKHIGPELRKCYGIQRKYTPDQVKKTVMERGYSSDYDCYALSMYCDYLDFVNYHRTLGESCDYNAMRSEITDFFDAIFQNATAFDADDVISLSDRIDSAQDVEDRSSWWSNLFDANSGSDFSSSGYDSDSGSDFSSGGWDSDSGGN